jgi:hypothetical protein
MSLSPLPAADAAERARGDAFSAMTSQITLEVVDFVSIELHFSLLRVLPRPCYE